MDYHNFQFAQEQYHNLVVARYTSKGDVSEKESFKNWISKLKSDGSPRIADEFAQLTKSLNNHKRTAEAWKRNFDYNRYQDMLCFDNSRIVLNDGFQPDYIHANYITGFHRKNAYILTQGPLPNTVVDFWRMVWQEGIATVVMATRLNERGKPKCARYFPETNDAPFYAGIFKITLKVSDKRQFCCATLLEVTNSLNHDVRQVAHVWYACWPDQGVPEDIDSLRHFLNFVKIINLNMSLTFYSNKHQHQRGPPILFHCSAGIGRSAVLVVLDIITESFIHHCHLDLLEQIKNMRQERFHVIHTKIQLLFVYHYVVVLAAHARFRLLEVSRPTGSIASVACHK